MKHRLLYLYVIMGFKLLNCQIWPQIRHLFGSAQWCQRVSSACIAQSRHRGHRAPPARRFRAAETGARSAPPSSGWLSWAWGSPTPLPKQMSCVAFTPTPVVKIELLLGHCTPFGAAWSIRARPGPLQPHVVHKWPVLWKACVCPQNRRKLRLFFLESPCMNSKEAVIFKWGTGIQESIWKVLPLMTLLDEVDFTSKKCHLPSCR